MFGRLLVLATLGLFLYTLVQCEGQNNLVDHRDELSDMGKPLYP